MISYHFPAKLWPPPDGGGGPANAGGRGDPLFHVQGNHFMKNYNKNNLFLAKQLRKNMTKWEKHLWYDFLSKYPMKFQRQKAIGNYIVDFYCAKAKFIVELDGKEHDIDLIGRNDIFRQQEFENMGFKVIRFRNTELNENFNKVCECIHVEVQMRLNEN